MKRSISFTLACICIIVLSLGFGLWPTSVSAEQTHEMISGKVYDLGDEGYYDLNASQEIDSSAERFYVKGDITPAPDKNGFTCFVVNSGNMSIMINNQYELDLFESTDDHEWHVITDKSKEVDGIRLPQSIGTGAIIVQTSRDGKTWITTDTETDIYNKRDTINNRSVKGEPTYAFYRTTNVQQTNGCYYRIIVAYRLKREIEPNKVLFVNIKNYEEKERLEVYQFYAYDPRVDQAEVLNTATSYEFSEVRRVDSQDGFKNPVMLKSDDPHIDWTVGKFYVTGYTDVATDGDVPVFLKVPGDRAALWFVLEQEIDKCNGDTGIKVNYIDSGSDIHFGTPTIDDLGRGALIIRKTDKQNKRERQIYTNYLEASATVGANTRVDLFEEGDYEVALDYQLHYDKPFVFGTTTVKTLSYQVFFKFKVRNGDISAFLRDIDTNQFITNANIAPHGFYIDVANSLYLTMTIKREVLSESLDGLVQDTKFSGVAKEGRQYTDEGIYTVTIKNQATGDSVTKRIYVGDRDILLVHMKTGMPINEINELLDAGAYIDDQGHLVEPSGNNQEPVEMTPSPQTDTTAPVLPSTPKEPQIIDSQPKQHEQTESKSNMIAITSVAVVLLVSAVAAFGRIEKKRVREKGDNQK